MQIALSRIWTRVTVSVTYDDNPDITNASITNYTEFEFTNFKEKD